MSARPTPGPWLCNNTFGFVRARGTHGDLVVADVVKTDGQSHDEYLANISLIAEAGTVYHETQLTPRELADQRAELLAALVDAEWGLDGIVEMHELSDKCERDEGSELCRAQSCAAGGCAVERLARVRAAIAKAGAA